MIPSSPETRQIVQSRSTRTSYSEELGFCVMANRQQQTEQSAQNSMDPVFPRLRMESFPSSNALVSSDWEFQGGRCSKSWIKSKLSHLGQMIWLRLADTFARSRDLLACENIQKSSSSQASEAQCSTSWDLPRQLRQRRTCSAILSCSP